MRFGQKVYTVDGQSKHGKWRVYETRAEALADGCHFVSILALACTTDEYGFWCKVMREQGKDPDRCRLRIPFSGPFYADFDRESDVAGLKDELATALGALIEGYGLPPTQLRLWFSGGKGFHLEIPAAVFGAERFCHRHLPTIYKRFGIMLGLGPLMDAGVYSESRGRLWRVPGIPRANGCRKTPLGFEELGDLTMSEIRKRSKAPLTGERPCIADPVVNPGLASLFQKAVRTVLSRERHLRTRNRGTSATRSGPKQRLAPVERFRIEEALDQLPPILADDYHGWLTIGMALHQGTDGSEEGLALWNQWSRQSPKYDPQTLENKWQTFNAEAENGVTLGTLFCLVNKARS